MPLLALVEDFSVELVEDFSVWPLAPMVSLDCELGAVAVDPLLDCAPEAFELESLCATATSENTSVRAKAKIHFFMSFSSKD